MYVEFDIPRIYFLPSNISIVLRLMTPKLHRVLIWRDFLKILIIPSHISLSVLVSVKPVEFVLSKYYVPKFNEE